MLNGYSGIRTRNFGLCLPSLLVGANNDQAVLNRISGLQQLTNVQILSQILIVQIKDYYYYYCEKICCHIIQKAFYVVFPNQANTVVGCYHFRIHFFFGLGFGLGNPKKNIFGRSTYKLSICRNVYTYHIFKNKG